MAIQTSKYSAKFVADSFVPWYYTNLYYHPEKAHRLYKEHSVLCWPGPDDAMTPVTTMQGIHEKIMSSDFKDFYRVIETVDAQESLGGGFILLVTGWFGKDDLEKNFSQTFFLVEQEKGLYVLNDVLKFFDVYESVSSVDHHDGEGNNQEAWSTDNCNLPYGMKKRIRDALAKFGRDSILTMTYENLKGLGQDGSSFGFVDFKSAGSSREVLIDKGLNSPDLSAHEDAMSIYIGNLPYGITKKGIKEVIKKFGRVKSGSDSIQIRRCENGSAYGFVDFVSAASARRAVEAHRVTFGEKVSYIAYKRLFNGG